MRLLSATAHHLKITRGGGATEYSLLDDNTGRKVAHVTVRRGFAHVTGTPRTAFEGLEAIIRLDGPDLTILHREFDRGVRNGRDDRNQ